MTIPSQVLFELIAPGEEFLEQKYYLRATFVGERPCYMWEWKYKPTQEEIDQVRYITNVAFKYYHDCIFIDSCNVIDITDDPKFKIGEKVKKIKFKFGNPAIITNITKDRCYTLDYGDDLPTVYCQEDELEKVN